MIYIGIDISKYKHDCFICNDTGDVIVENLSFKNTKHFTYAKFAKLKELAKNLVYQTKYSKSNFKLLLVLFMKSIQKLMQLINKFLQLSKNLIHQLFLFLELVNLPPLYHL